MKVIKFAPGLIPVLKHQEHDQSSHGNWATLTNTTFGDYKMTFEYQPSSELSLHFIHAYDQNKKQVGQLRWDSYTGTVNSISVEPEHQRKGIATAMWDWATQLSKTPVKDFPENIKHGWGIEKPRHDRFIVTPQGKSWVESLQKHEGGGHDQSSHGNWAEGSQGSSTELSDDEIRDVIYNSKTVNEMFQKVAKRLGKSMKPSVDTLSEDEITHYRGVQDVSRDAQRLLDGKVKFTEFQTWGQGIYLAEDKGIASNYGTLIGMKLDSSAKIVQGEITWDSAFDVSYDNPSARTRNTTTSSFIDLGRIETQIRAGKMDNLSISDMRNVYWAAKGYDGFTTYGETVLFNGSKLTISKADIGTAVQKHQEHDQKTHGNWATGGELANWNPTDTIPSSPRNAGGMTASIWENWEHGPDGSQYVELYRQYAGEALGIAVPKSPMDVGGSENYITQRGFGGSSTETARKQSEAIVKAIANGKPEQPALYRGMTATDADGRALLDSITKLKAGDTLDMPLVSTTRSLGVATWYAADRSPSGTGNVVMKIQPGAKGVSLSKEASRYPQDHEVITSGKFEVVSVSTVQVPYWQREVLRPSKTVFRDDPKPYYETVGVKQNLGDPKKVYEAVASGNWKSLETPTFKLTDDRHNYSVDRPILSAWSQQPAREFTVVEVKFVEPHVIQKAESNDYGMTFDALFNNVPFIREEDVIKHGEHDQKTHGNWAKDNFDEEALGEDAQNTYFDAYGVTTGAIKEPVGISRAEIRSLDEYTADGFKKINTHLREAKSGENKDESSGAKSSREAIEENVANLDKLIEESPDLFGDKNLYRIFSKEVIDSMEEGDVLTDKAFMSTTRVDITNPSNIETLQNLQLLTELDTKEAIILPSPSGRGKGLAVDYMKNAVSDFVSNTSTANSEKEVLLPRGTSLKFMGFKKINPMTDNVMDVAVFQRMDK